MQHYLILVSEIAFKLGEAPHLGRREEVDVAAVGQDQAIQKGVAKFIRLIHGNLIATQVLGVRLGERKGRVATPKNVLTMRRAIEKAREKVAKVKTDRALWVESTITKTEPKAEVKAEPKREAPTGRKTETTDFDFLGGTGF